MSHIIPIVLALAAFYGFYKLVKHWSPDVTFPWEKSPAPSIPTRGGIPPVGPKGPPKIQ
jgi:hypothetical protein